MRTFATFLLVSSLGILLSAQELCRSDTSFTDIIFLIDNSQSIDDQEFDEFSDIIIATIGKVNSRCADSQLGVVHYGGAFGTETEIARPLSANTQITNIERRFCTMRNSSGFCSEGGGDDLNNAIGDIIIALNNGELNRNPNNSLQLVIFTDAFGFDANCTFINCSVIRPFTNIDMLKTNFGANVTVVGASVQAEASLLAIYASPGGDFNNVVLHEDCATTVDGCESPRKYLPIEFNSPTEATSDSIANFVECNINIIQVVNPELGNNVSICGDMNESVLLTVSLPDGETALNYAWSPALPNSATVSVSPDVTTTYTVTVSDVNGCSGTDEVTVFVEDCAPDCSPDTSYADIVFLVDNSQSIDNQEFDNFENIIRTTMDKVQAKCQSSQIGLVHYGGAFGAETTVQTQLNSDNANTVVERQFCTVRNSSGFCSEGGGDDLNNAIGDIITAIEDGSLNRNPINKLRLVIFTDAFGFEAECSFINCSVIRPFTNIDRLKREFGAQVTVVGASAQAEASLLAVYASPGGQFDNVVLNTDCGSTFDGCNSPRKYIPIEFDSPVDATTDSIVSCVDCDVEILPGFLIDLGDSQTICSDLNESATISSIVINGVEPIQYTWDNGLPAQGTVTVQPTTTTVYTLLAIDGIGCETTSSITIVVADCVPDCVDIPVFSSCPDAFTTCPGRSIDPAITGRPVVVAGSVDCMIPILSYRDDTTAIMQCNVVISRVWTATYADFPNLVSSCVQSITVMDMEAPVITNLPDDIVVDSDQDCRATVSWTVPVATDDCELESVQSNIQSGTVFDIGVTEIRYSAVDQCGNISMSSFTVTVIEACCTAPPTLTCAPAYTGCPSSNIDPTVTGSPTAGPGSVNCPSPTLTFVDAIQDGSTDCGQTILRTWTASYPGIQDESLISTCVQNITLIDTENPAIINTPDNITIDSDELCTSSVAWGAPVASDNCGMQSLSSNFNSGDIFDVGSTTVTYTAIDDCGNISTSSFTVTIIEACCTSAPVLTCAPAYTGCPSSNIDPTVTGSPTAGPGSEYCINPILTFEDNLQEGSTDCQQTILRTWTASYPGGVQGSDLVTSCVQTITLTDSENPVITNIPANITLDSDELCTANVTWDEPIATDNCGIESLSSNINSGAIFDIGTTELTYIAIDNCGNSSTASFTITVIENCCTTPPIITCPPSYTTCPGSDINPSVAGIATGLPGSEECPNPGLSFNDEVAGSDDCTTTIRRTWTAAYGGVIDEDLFSECVQIITLIDNQPPLISDMPSNITIDSDGSCTAVVSWTAPSASDDCTTVSLTSDINNGTVFDVGVTTVTYTAIDQCENSSTASFTVRVIERCCTVPPVLTCPSDFEGCPGDPMTTELTGMATAVPGSIDCPIPMVTFSDVVISDTTTCYTVIERTFTASYPGTDNEGLTSSCVQMITLIDVDAPIITGLPADMVIASDANCIASVVWDAPIGLDNCAIGEVLADIPSGSSFDIGTTTVTYTVIDGCGNMTQDSFTVTITKACCQEVPALTWPADYLDCIGASIDTSVTGIAVAVGGSTFCQDPTVTFEDRIIFEGPNGELIIERIWTARDPLADSLFSIGVQIITLEDTEAPIISECPEDVTLDPDNPIHFWEDPVFTDNCSAMITSDNTNGSTFETGVTVVTFTVTDIGGNQVTCSFEVTVPEEVQIVCPDDMELRCIDDLVLEDLPAPSIMINCPACQEDNIDGFEFIGYRNGQSYYISDREDDWQEANTTAQSVGGYLAIINDAEENEYIKSLLNVNSAFIGLQDYDTEGEFIWSDGSSLTYSNWFDGQPNNYGNRQDYVEIMKSGQWNDQSNNKSLKYILEVDCVSLTRTIDNIEEIGDNTVYTVTYNAVDRCGTDDECSFQVTADNTAKFECPDDILVNVPYGWSRVSWEDPIYNTCCTICSVKRIKGYIYMGNLGDSYYYCSAGRSSWRAAARKAHNIGGNLVTIETSEENDYISSRIIRREAYIGLTDQYSEGNFRWVDGTTPSFSNWASSQPNADGDYVHIDANGYWSDGDGSEKREFVVEIKGCDHVDQIGGPHSGSTFRTGSTLITYQATDGCGGVDTCSFNVIITTDRSDVADGRSIEKPESISSEMDFDVYPNPVSKVLSVDIKSDLSRINEIQIFQSNGQLINTFNPARLNRSGVDVSNYSSGLYLMKITDDSGNIKVKKFTVK